METALNDGDTSTASHTPHAAPMTVIWEDWCEVTSGHEQAFQSRRHTTQAQTHATTVRRRMNAQKQTKRK